MFEQSGFKILRSGFEMLPASLEALKTMKVAPRFQAFSPEELAITNVHLLAQKI
jgi:hypothetical protein